MCLFSIKKQAKNTTSLKNDKNPVWQIKSYTMAHKSFDVLYIHRYFMYNNPIYFFALLSLSISLYSVLYLQVLFGSIYLVRKVFLLIKL